MLRNARLSSLIAILTAAFLLLPAAFAMAQADPAVTALARVDRVQITVGDWVGYDLIVNAPPGFAVDVPPAPTSALGEWEVRECAALPAATVDGGTQSGWHCTLTIWTVGYHALPTQIVKVVNPDGSSGRATTQPISIEVVSVLDEEANNIKPLKPQLTMTEQANYLLIIGLSLLAVLLAGFLVWAIIYWRNHRPVPALVEGPPPVRDPIGAALAELDRIQRMDLVAQNRMVDHYSLIADVLRRFISDRYSVPALERTTSEVRAALAHPAMLQRRDFLLALLAEADGVKFARQLPDAAQAMALLDHARRAIVASQ
ncbi:MAG TPA: hypothetical protein VD886_06100 [Herpetosiphonaceae bacterium]|nr:hypothetical protein [Herpetosiphonaceae bacterium]